MNEIKGFVGSLAASRDAQEGPMLQEDRVREILSRLERGEALGEGRLALGHLVSQM